MKKDTQDKTAERLATGIVAAFFTGFGWLDLLQGGISLKSKSGHEGFVDGGPGVAVACGAFLVAALCALLLARSFGLRTRGYVILVASVLIPPATYLLC